MLRRLLVIVFVLAVISQPALAAENHQQSILANAASALETLVSDIAAGITDWLDQSPQIPANDDGEDGGDALPNMGGMIDPSG